MIIAPPDKDNRRISQDNIKTMITTFDFNDGNGLVPAHRHKNPNGDFGGWVANSAIVEATVHVDFNSQVFGQAWVYDNAQVLDQALVYGEAQVYNQAQVYGDARIYGKAKIFDNAHIFGKGRVSGKALVFGRVWVSGSALIFDKAQVFGQARIFGAARINGEKKVFGQEQVSGDKHFNLNRLKNQLNRLENQGAQILGEEIDFWYLSVYDKGQFYSITCRSNEATKFSQEDNVDIFLNYLYSRWSKSGIIDSFVSYLDGLIEEKLWGKLNDFTLFIGDEYAPEYNYKNIINQLELLEYRDEFSWDYDVGSSEIYDNIDIYLLEDVKERYVTQEYKQWQTVHAVSALSEFDELLQFDMGYVSRIKTESKEITAKLNAIYDHDNYFILSTPVNKKLHRNHVSYSAPCVRIVVASNFKKK